MVSRVLVLGFVFLLAAAGPARAGIADSPVPLLGGTPAVTVFSVLGVMNAGGQGTYFCCTSTDKGSINVGVELFDAPGGGPVNNAAATFVTMTSGQTALFGTQPASALIVDSNLGNPIISRGSARVISSSTKLVCTAFVASTSAVPTQPATVTVTAKTKQKAAN